MPRNIPFSSAELQQIDAAYEAAEVILNSPVKEVACEAIELSFLGSVMCDLRYGSHGYMLQDWKQNPISLPVWITAEVIYGGIGIIKHYELMSTFLMAGISLILLKECIPPKIIAVKTANKVGKTLPGVGIIPILPDSAIRDVLNNFIIRAPQIIEFIFRSGGYLCV